MTIVAAVDRSEGATAIVQEAARLGEAFDERVDVVHVLGREEFVSLERTSVSQRGSTVPVEDVIEMASKIAEDTIGAVGADANAVGLMGDPAEEITDYADDEGASYIVIGGRKRSPVGKALFGSVVQTVLLNANCPVVSLRLDSD
jgi:nucleotide-binding universal stress UspA family protein